MELPSRNALKQNKILVRVIIRGDVEAERVRSSESHHFFPSMLPDTVVQTASSSTHPQAAPISVSVPEPSPVSVSDVTQLERKTQKNPSVSPNKPAPQNTLVLPTQSDPKTTMQLPHQPAPKNTLALPHKPILKNEPLPDNSPLEKKIQKNQSVSPNKPAPQNTLVLSTQPAPKNTLPLPKQAAPKNTLHLPDKLVLKNKTLPSNRPLPQNGKKLGLKHFNLDILKLLSFGAFTAGLTAWLQNKAQDNKSILKAQTAAWHLEKAISNCIITIQEASLLSHKYRQLTSLLNSTNPGNQAFKSSETKKHAEKDLIESRTLYNAKLLELGDNITQLQLCFSSYQATIDQKKTKAFSHPKEPDKSSNRVLQYYSYLLGHMRNSNPSMMSYKDLEKLAIVQSNLDQLIEKDSANIPIYTGYNPPQVIVPPELVTKYNAIN